MLYKMRVGGEIVLLAVLKDEDAIFSQQSALEDQRWDCRKLLQRIRRVGKNKIKLLLTRLYEAEDITTDGQHVRCLP